MINADELLFVVDAENNPLEPQPRFEAHKNGSWHRTTGIWVINRDKQVLCQKRSLLKDKNPGKWEAFFGGHLGPGEEAIDNTVKEIGEELGIKVEANDMIPYKFFKSDKPTHKEFLHIFAYILDTNSTNFQFEKDEIDALEWKKIKDLRKILVEEKNPNWVIKTFDPEILSWLETLT